MVTSQAKMPSTSLAATRLLPAVVVIGAVSAVAGYVRSQLRTESHTMDRFFAQYKNAQSEESRRRVFEQAREDPRKSLYNILGW
ncbi:hypothetical protein NKR23_g10512 [Pleurostoma richardsiae]|uniref:Uncharacterized protein n=1 Tax=Pleurostoma richardsiae TaxID=41990 RepID=A0AA38VLH4_9PEZI|nr:hypothetical protein NKR23_g10512 [Pleurostoma richardsiae]